MDNAETIANLNSFEETFRRPWPTCGVDHPRGGGAVRGVHLRADVSSGRCDRPPSADLDQYENGLKVGLNGTLPVITKNMIDIAYAKGADDRRDA